MENVTFNCTVPAGSSAAWEINGAQSIGQDQIDKFSRLGVFVFTDGQYSVVTVTQMARLTDPRLSIQCLSTHNQTLGTTKTEDFSVVTFGRLKSDETLTLCSSSVFNMAFYYTANAFTVCGVYYNT